MNIASYHCGHGLSVCDKDTIDPRTNDYESLAFIYPSREVVFYKNLHSLNRKLIINIAATDDRSVSITQSETKVFLHRPDKDRVIFTKDEFR